MNEINETFAKPAQSYFIGTFGFEGLNDEVYRNWRNDPIYDS